MISPTVPSWTNRNRKPGVAALDSESPLPAGLSNVDIDVIDIHNMRRRCVYYQARQQAKIPMKIIKRVERLVLSIDVHCIDVTTGDL